MLHQRDPLQADSKAMESLINGETTRETIKCAYVGESVQCTHSVAHRALQRSILFGLAADVVEGEQ